MKKITLRMLASKAYQWQIGMLFGVLVVYHGIRVA